MTTHAKSDTTVDFDPFRDLTQAFEQFKMPGADMSAFAEARRKDFEALVAANKVTYEALQALARTQTEMLTHAMQSIQESGKSMLAGGKSAGAGPDLAQHAEASQKVWAKMLADMNGLAEMMRKAQTEAMAGLTERATENMAAIKGPARPK